MIQLNLHPPAIKKFSPRQSGLDNQGIGYTQFGERYLLKTHPSVCVAEFVGAILCKACDVPVAEPTIVEMRGKKVFGSRLESGVVLPKSITDVIDQVKACENKLIFSAVLAIDLALGNNDRHWHNWLPQPQEGGSVLLRAVDFSRAWPTCHPPCTFESMRDQNTGKVCREDWPTLGISLDSEAAISVCVRIASLSHAWLQGIFQQMPVEWMVGASGPELCDWWKRNWVNRVEQVQEFLESGAWT